MNFRSFVAYLRTLDWKVWSLATITALAICAFCGWVVGGLIIGVAVLALLPAIKIGMRAEVEKRRRVEEEDDN